MSIVQNPSNRKSYGRVVSHMLVWRRICNGAANNPQYSMSRFNNQLPCEPLSNAWVLQSPIDLLQKWKAGKLRFTTDSAGMSAFVWDIWMCVRAEPEGQQNETLTTAWEWCKFFGDCLACSCACMYVMCVYRCGCGRLGYGDFTAP